MRKYTSKKQKTKMYAEKYNMEEEEVNRILSEYEDLLTLDELKIRYDNPNIGILPEWLSEKSLDNMIWKTVHTFWSPSLQIEFGEKIALYDYLYEIVLKKSNLLINHANTKALLVNAIKTIIDVRARRGKYFYGSLDEINIYDEKNNDNARARFNISDSRNEDNLKMLELLDRVHSIKDRKLQSLIIITGYLICNISEFESDYLNLINNCDDNEIKDSILLLEDRVLNNDKIDFKKLELIENKEDIKPIKKQRITIFDICKGLKLNIFKSEYGKNKTQQLHNFLMKNNILDVLTSY